MFFFYDKDRLPLKSPSHSDMFFSFFVLCILLCHRITVCSRGYATVCLTIKIKQTEMSVLFYLGSIFILQIYCRNIIIENRNFIIRIKPITSQSITKAHRSHCLTSYRNTLHHTPTLDTKPNITHPKFNGF